jgi:penicillin amidase
MAPGTSSPALQRSAHRRGDRAPARVDYSNPTGIQAGFDPGDNPSALGPPSQAEIDASVAATLWATWRSYALRNTIDGTLTAVGLKNYLPGTSDSFTGLKWLLDAFPVLQGKAHPDCRSSTRRVLPTRHPRAISFCSPA